MQTTKIVSMVIPADWDVAKDEHYFRTHHGHEIGKPCDVMRRLLEDATKRFEASLDHTIRFMKHIDQYDPQSRPGNRDDLTDLSRLLSSLASLPLSNEAKM